MYIMDQTSSSGLYEDCSLAPLSQVLAPLRTEPLPELWNPQAPHPTSVAAEGNHPTYTSLETVYPEIVPDSHNVTNFYHMIFNSNESGSVDAQRCAYYRDEVFTPVSREQVFQQMARDEGIGSSPSSLSSNSPPLPQFQPVPLEQQVSTTPPNGYEYTHYSTSSTPESVGSNYSAAPECSNCGSRSEITWVETHYLCRQCLLLINQQRPASQQQLPPKRPAPLLNSSNKRKKAVAASKNLEQICSNCETPTSTLWRRSISNGQTVCNACGLYEKLHLSKRPKSMRKDTPQTRKRKTKAASQQQKDKNPPKKNSKKSPDIRQPVQQPQYIHQNFSLPNYNTFNQQIDENQASFRSDQYIYNSVPPNAIIPQHTMPSNLIFTSS